MKIAALQFNPTVGDLQRNTASILQKTKEAYAAGARIIITPELALCGYPPVDLLLRPAFMQACDAVVAQLVQACAELPDLYLLLGHPVAIQQLTATDPLQRYNAVSVINAGRIQQIYAKQILMNAHAVDDSRYFLAGQQSVVFEVQGTCYGVLIGNDVLAATGGQQTAKKAIEAGAKVLLVSLASPYYLKGQEELESQTAKLAKTLQVPIITTQMVGGQDELVFSGGSFAVDARGELLARAKQFAEEIFYLEPPPHAPKLIDQVHAPVQGQIYPLYNEEESLWRALVMGLKDYLDKNGFTKVVLGLSGGMDSALVLALAVDALGAKHVSTVMMPSPYTADISCEDAREMAERLGVRYDVISIAEAFTALQHTLAPVFSQMPMVLPEDSTQENLQARIRGTILMAISNKTGALVLATGNKSEVATGYCTLYGDTVGGFAPIKDLLKTRVYQLARWRNAHDPFKTKANPIPERIITRPPSAELRSEQTDQDSLPPYEILDAIIERYVEQNQSIKTIVKSGYTQENVETVTRLVKINEYKRRQAPIGVKLTRCAFGGDWRYPITSKFRA